MTLERSAAKDELKNNFTIQTPKKPRGGQRPGAGRPRGKASAAKKAIAEMAREHAEAAPAILVRVAEDDEAPHSSRVTAATAILDRGYGKPVAAVEHTGKDGSTIQTEATTRVVIVPAKLAAAPIVRKMLDDEEDDDTDP